MVGRVPEKSLNLQENILQCLSDAPDGMIVEDMLRVVQIDSCSPKATIKSTLKVLVRQDKVIRELVVFSSLGFHSGQHEYKQYRYFLKEPKKTDK